MRVQIPLPERHVSNLAEAQESFSDPGVLDVEKYLKQHSQAEDIIAAYNDYIRHGMQNQLAAIKIPYGPKEEYYMTFNCHSADRPSYTDIDNNNVPLYPAQAKNQGLSYMAVVYGRRIGYHKNTDEVHEIGAIFEMYRIPVMVGSILCYRSSLKERIDLELIGENPDDPGGYFIYNGNIRIIPASEKMRLNRIFISPAVQKHPFDRVSQTINVPTGTAVNTIFEKKVADSAYIGACHFTVSKMKIDNSDTAKKSKTRNSINILNIIDIICFLYQREDLLALSREGPHYAVGVIQSLICTPNPDLQEKQRRAVIQALQGTIFEYQAGAQTEQRIGELLTWLDSDSEKESFARKREVLKIFIRDHVFWSVPIMQSLRGEEIVYNVEEKIRAICFLTCQFLLYKTGYEPITDKNNWANRKVDSAIVGMSQYFWAEYQRVITKKIKGRSDEVKTLTTAVHFDDDVGDTLTNAFLAPFNKPVVEGTTGSAFEPSQTINPTNLVHLMAEVTKIQVKVDKKVKSQGVRSIQGSQFGYICPAQTPDGIKCGMVKRKSILSHYTILRDPTTIIEFCKQKNFVSPAGTFDKTNLLVVGGIIIGWCNAPILKELLSSMKRGTPAAFSMSEKQDNVLIQARWYEFDVIRAVKLIFAQNKEIIRPDKDKEYRYALRINNVFFSYINKKIKALLAFQSALPRLDADTAIVMDDFGRLCIFTDAGRLMRAVYIVRDNTLYNTLVKNELPDFELLVDSTAYDTRSLSYDEMQERGFVEYIDAYEEADPNFYYAFDRESFYSKLANDKAELDEYFTFVQLIVELEGQLLKLKGNAFKKGHLRLKSLNLSLIEREKEIAAIKRMPIRCVGIHGVSMFGVAATYAPLSTHDPAGKTVHTSKTIMQTLGLLTSQFAHRKQDIQLISNMPLTVPSITAQFGDRRSFLGRNVPMGFIDMRENQEDAVIFSSLLLDLGYLNYARQFTIETEIVIMGQTVSQYLGISSAISAANMPDYKHLTKYGLPPIGYHLKEGDVAIAKYEIDKNRDVEQPIPVIVDKGESGRVMDIMISLVPQKKKDTAFKVRVSLLIQGVYRPEIGDKFSFMHGQKSVLGAKVIAHEDMPFDAATGTSPLVMMNTHSIKNRQTMGLILEQFLGIHAAMYGKAYDTTAFVKHDLDAYIKELSENGINFAVTQFIVGKTGQHIRGYRYVGYARLQQLHHFAHKKYSVKGYAATDALTTQRMKTAKVGGDKFGEMEKNALVGYGAQGLHVEKFRTNSDEFVCQGCTACQIFTLQFEEICPHCGAYDTLLKVVMPGSFEYFKRVSAAINIKISSAIGTEEDYAEYQVKTIQSKDNLAHSQNYVSTHDDEYFFREKEEND